ncbi:glucoamylase family protein [Bacillus sp. NEB1478]|uniref:glucoamylase family protein n=1 Tax=Bacillus sp. NEB1478 TaxID=3073816 RepID=UPI002873134E|nr:glucoamylase family protein [Bacillus sp. NEB1478]WNB92648.1 glucoamylase family protein [Bacillus sp. NEB1478]
MDTQKLLEAEAKGCFDFFWNEANSDKYSPGYGLILDQSKNKKVASIASVGFGLTAIIIGIERGWITREQGYERTKGTLETFLNNVEQESGFFYHFLDMQTGKKNEAFYDCASIIDTTLFLSGAITSAEYFGGEIAALFEQIFARVDWTIFYDEKVNQYYMGYTPERGGFGHWDMYAEQMIQYVLGVASPTHPVPAKIYEGFDRRKGTYGDYEYVNSPGGALFVHQYSHAFIDFRGVVDGDGNEWFENSVKATLANRQFCIDKSSEFKTYHENSWGLTASASPTGYRVPGAPPYHPNCEPELEGTVAPTGATGSIVFTPEESIAAMKYFYENHPQLWGEYGFWDSYNLDVSPPWYSDHVIGIDKGITLLMIENYQTGLVWDLYMKNKYVQLGIEMLGWKKKEESRI